MQVSNTVSQNYCPKLCWQRRRKESFHSSVHKDLCTNTEHWTLIWIKANLWKNDSFQQWSITVSSCPDPSDSTRKEGRRSSPCPEVVGHSPGTPGNDHSPKAARAPAEFQQCSQTQKLVLMIPLVPSQLRRSWFSLFIWTAALQGCVWAGTPGLLLQLLTKHNVFPIQPITLGARDEELAAVGTRATVCLGVENGKIQLYSFRLAKTKGRHIKRCCSRLTYC